MQKRANRANQLVLFFSAGANFWSILGHFWSISTILGHFWANLGNLGSFLGHFLVLIFWAKNLSLLFLLLFPSLPKITQKLPKIAQFGPKMTQNGPKMART